MTSNSGTQEGWSQVVAKKTFPFLVVSTSLRNVLRSRLLKIDIKLEFRRTFAAINREISFFLEKIMAVLSDI